MTALNIKHYHGKNILKQMEEIMKAIVYDGIQDVKVKNVNDPSIEKSDDIIIKVTSTAICGSALHLVHGLIPDKPKGFELGQETMGIVVEAGNYVT